MGLGKAKKKKKQVNLQIIYKGLFSVHIVESLALNIWYEQAFIQYENTISTIYAYVLTIKLVNTSKMVLFCIHCG